MTCESPRAHGGLAGAASPAGASLLDIERSFRHRPGSNISQRVLDVLDVLDAATADEIALLLDSPVKPVRRALLDLYRAGVIERVLLLDGCLYARRVADVA